MKNGIITSLCKLFYAVDPMLEKDLPHKCDFRKPIMHNGRYWMRCTVPGCLNVKDCYLRSFSTNNIDKVHE